MDMVHVKGEYVPCADYSDAIVALQFAYPEEWDALHYIHRNVQEVVQEAENLVYNKQVAAESDACAEIEYSVQDDFENIRDRMEMLLSMLDSPKMTAGVKRQMRQTINEVLRICHNNNV